MRIQKCAAKAAILMPLLVGLTSCAGITNMFGDKQGDGPADVDDLLSQVETVHIESELSIQAIDGALAGIMAMVGPEYEGDPEGSYQRLVEAIEASEEQAEELRDAVADMERSGNAFFGRWSEDLEAFTSPQMRGLSEERMKSARARYQEVVKQAGPARDGHGAINARFGDHALYFANDFSFGAVTAIERELRTLMKQSQGLEGRMRGTMAACEEYIRESALRGQVPGGSGEFEGDTEPPSGQETAAASRGYGG